MNGVTDGTANLYLRAAEYRMGLEVDGLSSGFVFRLNIPQLFFSLFELGFFLLLFSALCSNEVQGENWREQTSQSYCRGLCFQGLFCCCVSSSFPYSYLAYFQTGPLQWTSFVPPKLHCEWLLPFTVDAVNYSFASAVLHPTDSRISPTSLSQHIYPIFKVISSTNPIVQWTGSSFQHSVTVSLQTTILF